MSSEVKNWHCLRLIVPKNWSEDISAHCFELGSCGVQSEKAGEAERLIAYFDAALDREAICRGIEEYLRTLGLGQTAIAAAELEERDWEAEWRSHFSPVWVTERIVVHPSWIPVETRDDQIAIVIDPRMAFGTGGHESTQLCLQMMEDMLAPGVRCLDLGTGSGILAIAALRLGAASVLAVDIDQRAVANARDNLLQNGVEGTSAEVRQGSIDQIRCDRFDLIMANIQSHILRPMLRSVREHLKLGGRVVFSGLLDREERTFRSVVEEVELDVERIQARKNWICIVAQRPL